MSNNKNKNTTLDAVGLMNNINPDNLLLNVINTSEDLIFIKDTQLRTILCNTHFSKAVGKEPEELYGLTDIENGWSHELVKGDPKNGVRGYEADDLDALSGKTVHIDKEPVYINGELRYFNTIKTPYYDEGGNVIGAMGISRDITDKNQEHKQTDGQLAPHRQSKLISTQDESHYTALEGINIIGYGVFLIDRHRDILYSNDIAKEICSNNKDCFDIKTVFATPCDKVELWLADNIEDIIENENVINSIPRAISLERSSSNVPLFLMISKQHNDSLISNSTDDTNPLFIIFISEPTRDITLPIEMYTKLFKLSKAEARIVHYIVNGMKVNQLAEHLDIAVSTIRKHLRNIFTKTHTKDQVELIRLVISSSVWCNSITYSNLTLI